MEQREKERKLLCVKDSDDVAAALLIKSDKQPHVLLPWYQLRPFHSTRHTLSYVHVQHTQYLCAKMIYPSRWEHFWQKQEMVKLIGQGNGNSDARPGENACGRVQNPLRKAVLCCVAVQRIR